MGSGSSVKRTPVQDCEVGRSAVSGPPGRLLSRKKELQSNIDMILHKRQEKEQQNKLCIFFFQKNENDPNKESECTWNFYLLQRGSHGAGGLFPRPKRVLHLGFRFT